MQKNVRNDNRKKINASFVAIIMLLSTMTTMMVFLATPENSGLAAAEPTNGYVCPTPPAGLNIQEDDNVRSPRTLIGSGNQLIIMRGDGFVDFALPDTNHQTSGTITFAGATILGINNAVQPVYDNVESQGDYSYSLGNPGQDEVFVPDRYTAAVIPGSTTAEFFLTTSNAHDWFSLNLCYLELCPTMTIDFLQNSGDTVTDIIILDSTGAVIKTYHSGDVIPLAVDTDGDGIADSCDDDGPCESYKCLLPDTIGDDTDIDVQTDRLQSRLDDYTYVDYRDIQDIIVTGPGNDQSHIQRWNYEADMDTIEFYIEFVGKEAGYSNVFGYYTDGDTSTFTPLFQVPGTHGVHDGYPDVPVLLPTQSLSQVLVPKGSSGQLGFAICSDDGGSTEGDVGNNYSYYTENISNIDGIDHSLVYELCNDTYVICFEDIYGGGDEDYEDVVVIMKVTACYKNLDFGDAPDPLYSTAGEYPTLLANDGARHNIGGPYLGSIAPDAETDGQPDADALGDDNNGIDDEDGVTIPPLEIGQTNYIGLVVNGATGSAYIDGWIDYDQDGIWESSEYIHYYLPDGSYSGSVNVPSGLSTGTTYARFRISSQGCSLPTGIAQDGEVEDYKVELVDTIEPTQTVEFGNPKDPDAYPAGGNLWRIGGKTPIWVNSTDFGTGTKFIEIYVWWDSTHTGPNQYDTVVDYYYVDDWDGSGGYTGMDTDPTPGRISVIIYIDESCYHEIDAFCEDNAGNRNEYYGPEFLVDADGPTITKEIGDPQCGDYLNMSTKIWLNATDPIVGDINCSTQCVDSIYWIIWRWIEEDWELIGEYSEQGDKAVFTFTEECKHKLQYWAVDCLGNFGPKYEQIHYVDETAPTSTIKFDPDCYDPTGGGKTYIKNTSLITISAQDNKGLCNVGSTIIHYHVWANGQWTPWMTGNVDQDVTFRLEDLGAPWENDCTHYIEYYAEDCLHNTEQLRNNTVYVDNTPPEKPEINIVSGPSYIRTDGKVFVTTDTFIALSSEDQIQPDCASGVTYIKYQIWYKGIWGPVKTYTDEFNFTENCTHIIKTWAIDCLGNVGEENITTFYVDEEKPEITTEYIPGFYPKGGRNWISANTIKRIVAIDKGCNVGGAGVAMLEWKVVNTTADPDFVITNITYDNKDGYYEDEHVIVTGDNDPREGIISIDIQILEQCNHTIWHRGIDFLGNDNTPLGWGHKQLVKVDTKPPIVTKNISEPKWPHPDPAEEGNYFITNQTRIWINATDDPSTYPCVVGSVHLKIGVWYNGHWEFWWNNVTDGEIHESFTFEELAERLNWPEVANECVHYVTYWAEDDVGNSILEDNETFYVDMTPPDTDKIIHPPFYDKNLPAGATPGEDFYIRGDTPIQIKVEDKGIEPCIVGSTHLYYRIWYDGVWHYYEEHSLNGIDITFSFDEKDLGGDCVHYLEYYVEDNLENRWPECGYHNETFYVDNTPPTVTKDVGEPKYNDGSLPIGDWYITKDTPIWINVTEQGIEPCIVGSTTLYISILYKGQWYNDTIHHEKTDGPINERFTFAELAAKYPGIDDDCEHVLRIWAHDNLGNNWPVGAPYHEETFYVDNTPPTVTKDVGEPKYKGDLAGTNDWYVTKDTPIWVNVTDDQTKGCAVNSTHIKFTLTYNGRTESWWENSSTSQNIRFNGFGTFKDYLWYEHCIDWPEIGNDCEHIFTYEAWDDLGNYFGSHTETFYVDNQAPNSTKEVGEPKYDVGLSPGDYYVTNQTPIWINATDDTTFDPCVVGSVHLHYRVFYEKTQTYTQWENITVSSGTLSKMITLEGECVHRLDYWVEDNLHNRWPVDSWHSEWFFVDNSEPEVIKTVDCPKYKGDLTGEGDWYITNQTRIKIDVTEQGTQPCIVGSTTLYYSVYYDGVWYNNTIHNEKVDGPIHFEFTFESLAAYLGIPILADDCIHILRIWAEDNLKNHWPADKEYHEEIFYVDNTPPVTTKTIDEPYCPFEGDVEIFEDNFDYDSCNNNPLDHGWLGDYFENPDSEYIKYDIDTRYVGFPSGYSFRRVAEIDDDATMIRTISTKGFENIILSYCRRTSDTSNNDRLKVGWKVGKHTSNLGHYNGDEDWDADWNELESIRELWDCVSFDLPADAWDKEYISIAFFMDDGNGDYGLVDNVKVTGNFKEEQPYYWVTTHSDITLNAVDYEPPCDSGVKKIHYEIWHDKNKDGFCEKKVECKNVYENTVTFTFEEECLHKLVWYAVDNVGNKELLHIQYHRVDDTPPEIIKTVGEPSITDDEETWWVTTDTEINLTAIDLEEPCAVGGVSLWYNISYRTLEDYTGWLLYEGNITFDEHCTHYLHVKAVDCLGNTAYDNETFIVHGEIDQIPTLQSPVDGSKITDDTPTLDWNGVVGQKRYILQYTDTLQYDDNGSFIDAETVIIVGSSEYTIPPGLSLEDGIYYWHVAVLYTADVIGQYSDTWWFDLDASPPCFDTLTISGLNYDDYYAGTITITTTGTTEDTEKMVFEYYNLEEETWYPIVTDWESPFEAYFDTTEVNDGERVIRATAYDYSGKTCNQTTAIIYIDNTGPGVDITSPDEGSEVSGSSVNVGYTTDDYGGCGESLHTFEVDGEHEGVIHTNPYIWDTTGLIDGEHIIKVKVSDSLGNEGYDWILVTVDNTPECIAFVSPIAGEWYTEDLTAEVTAPDDTSRVEFTACDGFTHTDNDGSNGWTATNIPTGTGDGECVITATAYDEQGTVICVRQTTVMRDNTPPPVPGLFGLVGDACDNDGTVTWIWTPAVDPYPGVGIEFYMLDFYNDCTTVYGGPNDDFVSYTFSDLPDGDYPAQVKAVDKLGNEGDWSSIVSVTVDTTLPTVDIFKPMEGTEVSGLVDIEWTTSETTYDEEVSIDGAEFFPATGSGYYWSWDTTLEEDGAHTVTVRATDGCGNVGQDEIIVQVDNTPGSVSIIYPVNGQEFNNLQPGETVIVTVTAPDNTDYVEFTGDCITGTQTDNDPEWEYIWNLGDCGDGYKTITATAYDENGDVIDSDSVTVNVISDTTPPVVTITNPTEGTSTDTSFELNVETDEIAICEYDIDSSGSWITMLNTNSITHSTPITGLLDGAHTIDVRATDTYGNQYGTDSVTWTVTLTGPTTSGTDVEPDSAIVGTQLEVTATVHSTISEVVDAEYFLGSKGASGTGTALNPVDGTWDGTSEDVSGTIDTTDWSAGEYKVYVHGLDANGHWGAFDEEEFTLVEESQWRPIMINIIEPMEDDGCFEVECENKYIPVTVEAYRPAYNGLPEDTEVDVTIWLDQPYGAPDLFYEPDQSGKYFTTEIPVYLYSSGSELNLEAKAEDENGNRAYDDTTFCVTTTIEYDLWLEEGWNGPINLAVLGCSDATEDVFASIDPYYDFVFEVGTWYNYWNNQEEATLEGGTLQTIQRDGWYWIHMTEAARFYIDSTCPDVEIMGPPEEIDHQCFDISGYACDTETGVKKVELTIYHMACCEGMYWDGENWVETETYLPCSYDDTTHIWTYAEDVDLTYLSGEKIILTACATDYAGCTCCDTSWFYFNDTGDPIIHIANPLEATYGCGEPSLVNGTAYDNICETVVTDVTIVIRENEPGPFYRYWDGGNWIGSETELACDYDELTREWIYNGALPEWENEPTYTVFAYAYDAAANKGSAAHVLFDCYCGNSISGNVYYYGECSGDVYVYLLDDLIGMESMPLDTYMIPDCVQGRPIVGAYEFTGLPDGTYYTVAFMDYDDNETYDAWEPLGFAINKTWYGDDITVGPDQTDQDITLYEPDPDIDLTKYVWNGCYWDDEEAYVGFGESALFNISIHNDGNSPLYLSSIIDYLPDGLDYVEGSAYAKVVSPWGTQEDYFEPDQYPESGYTRLEWIFEEGMMLFPCNWFYIEFEAEVLHCEAPEGHINEAEVYSWYGDDLIYDWDNATVWGVCPEECEPGIDVEKYTWCSSGEQWTSDDTYFTTEDTVYFNITVENTGTTTLTDWYIDDWLEEGLSYNIDSCTMKVIQDDTVWDITGTNAQPQNIQYHVLDGDYYYTVLEWWETGSEPFTFDPGTIIIIHLSATVTSTESCDWYENWACADGDACDTTVHDEDWVSVWVNCE